MLDIYQLALDNEQVPNSTALLERLQESTPVMWVEAHALGLGTEYVNTHPVMMVLADRLHILAHPNEGGIGITKTYHAAVYVCQQRAGTDYSQRLVAEKGAQTTPA
jgi:hypothetical protein